jgi:hypothetical protein
MSGPSGERWLGEELEPRPSAVEYLKALKRSNQADGTSAAAPTAVNGPAAPSESASGTPERRLNLRYKCQGSVEFRVAQSDVRTWATVTDISRSGCYVEMQATSAVNTCFGMLIEIDGIRVRTQGVVRVRYPFLGMGIAFSEMSEEDRAKLEEILVRLAASVAPTRVSGTANVDSSQYVDDGEVVQAITTFFRKNRLLSHAEFREILSKQRKKL